MLKFELSDLSKCCRDNDDDAVQYGLEQLCKRYGMEAKDLKYLAEQRALRQVLHQRGEQVPTSMKPIALSKDEEAQIKEVSIIWMDAFMAGLRATLNKIGSNN